MLEINFNKLKKRDNLYYLMNEEKPFTGRAICYYKIFFIATKRIKRKIEMRDGVYHGDQFVYYRDGQIAKKSYFFHGKCHCEMVDYYESGQIKCKATYYDGLLHGETIYYFENGNVMSKYKYCHGIKE